ncbi:MAG: short-chain dehydrogenase [Rhodospirillaceae bacterium]|nr:short-chain dehydrogenase [Rhodospirillaceae bacterium]|tara:strand:+ start:664 stop:1440 length:777 start_codon:yes stop_codon:yes gene_type:complete
MANRLSKKRAIITGGAGGIGNATGKLFCAEGAEVVLIDQDSNALEISRKHIYDNCNDAKVVSIIADISDEKSVIGAVEKAAERMNGIDILVNNAGIRKFSFLTDSTTESWQDILSVNLLGTAFCSNAVMPYLRQSPNAAIVNVSSVYGVIGRKNMGQYDATKAAINSMTRTLANEEAENSIRVNAVCPGGTLTPFHQARFAADGMDEEGINALQSDITLMKRWATVEEIAYPILWLASDEASFITGAILMVDGGKSAM